MSQGILAIAEQIDGVFRKVTYEALSEGKRMAGSLGCDLTAVVLGAGVEDISLASEVSGLVDCETGRGIGVSSGASNTLCEYQTPFPLEP